MAGNFVAEAFSLLAIALVVNALRWISRTVTVGFSKLAADILLPVDVRRKTIWGQVGTTVDTRPEMASTTCAFGFRSVLYCLLSPFLRRFSRSSGAVSPCPIIGRPILIQAVCYVKAGWRIWTHHQRDFCQPAISKLQVAVLITLNISTDFYLMTVPLPVGLEIPRKLVRRSTDHVRRRYGNRARRLKGNGSRPSCSQEELL